MGDKFTEYDKLYTALEQCDTNQLRLENIRLHKRVLELEAIDHIHNDEMGKLEKERDFYVKAWERRGKALEMPCLACGYTGQAIRLKGLVEP